MVQAQTTHWATCACMTNISLYLQGKTPAHKPEGTLQDRSYPTYPHLQLNPGPALGETLTAMASSTAHTPQGHPDFLVWHVSPRHSHDLASCLPCSYKPSRLSDTCPVGSLCSPASPEQSSSFPVWTLQLRLLPEMLMFQEHPPPGPARPSAITGYLHLGPFWLPITASPSRLLGTLAGSEAFWALSPL